MRGRAPGSNAVAARNNRCAVSMPIALFPRLAARTCAGVVAIALLAAARIVSGADGIELTPQRISEHVWFFQGGTGVASAANKGFMSNAGFVVTGDGVVVFDALGTPALGRAMVAAIGKVTPAPIRRVIVSHYHADHIYGLQALKAAGAGHVVTNNSIPRATNAIDVLPEIAGVARGLLAAMRAHSA